MIKTLRNNKESVFHWLLALSGITLVFPDYSLNSKTILLLGLFWLLIYSDFKEKKYYFKQNYKKILAVSIFYLLGIAGLIYTDNMDKGVFYLLLRFPLLLLPVFILTSKADKESFYFTWRYFSYATFAVSLLALIKAVYFELNHLGDYLFYDRFSILTNKHATYFALFVIIAILYFFYQLIELKRKLILDVLGIVFLMYILFIISNRISFIALVLALSLVFFLKTKKIVVKLALPIIGATGIFFLFQTPDLQNRLTIKDWDKYHSNDLELRMQLWKLAGKEVWEKSPVIGNGTGAQRTGLYQRYLDNGYQIAYEKQFNTHNQFVDLTLDFGLLGLLLFTISIVYILYAIRKDYWQLALFSIFLVFLLTETILNRHSGVAAYALFTTLMLLSRRK